MGKFTLFIAVSWVKLKSCSILKKNKEQASSGVEVNEGKIALKINSSVVCVALVYIRDKLLLALVVARVD